MKKIRVGILFGGRSAEHEVSLQSAKSVIDAIDKEKYETVLIGIDKKGQWHLGDTASHFLLNSNNPKLIALNKSSKNVVLVPGKEQQQLVSLTPNGANASLDVIFPVLHGPFGEDGTVQGLLKLANLPFVGPSVLGSAIGMDKDVAKRLLRDGGIPIAKFVALFHHELQQFSSDQVIQDLGLPLFVKPANLGSSIGVTKVKEKEALGKAIKEALQYDNKILIEEYVPGKEIDCAVLGNTDNAIASVLGENIPVHHEFYDYDAKYIDADGVKHVIPADVDPETTKKMQEMAVKVFHALACEGMARVDFFLTKEKKICVNEINTIPGMRHISNYPMLFEKSGIPYPELLDRLISLAIKRFEREQKLKTTVDL